MLSTVETHEYLERRRRLGFAVPRVLLREVQPKPKVEEVVPHKHETTGRDWLNVTNLIGPTLPVNSTKIIIGQTARRYGVSVAEIKGPRRDKLIVQARHECCYRMHKELGYSLSQIGRILSRDHSTIFSGIRRHELRLRDPGIDDRPTRKREKLPTEQERC